MKHNTTYQLYKGSLDQLRQLKGSREVAPWRNWIRRFSFSMLFVMCSFALIVSVMDDGLLTSVLSSLSDDPRFVREGTEVLSPFFQLGLVVVILALLWFNQMELRLRNRENQLKEQERIIQAIRQRMED